MSKEQKENHKKGPSYAPKRSLKKAILLTGMSSIIVLLLLFFFFRPEWSAVQRVETTPFTTDADQDTIHQLNPPDLSRLQGRWKRTDGDYIMEIQNTSSNGVVVAGYFNPKPIHVGRAAWAIDKGSLYVMVELQDVNYPGSTYGLQYDRDADKLTGMYFQAVEESTFQVEFEREK